MADFAAGSVFSGYRIEGVAGRGGMGVVYRATQVALRRPVALKVIVPELADDGEFRARFERESYLAASIDHPNVVPIYEAGETDGRLFISMRWVEGVDLRTVISQAGRLEAPRAVSIIEQIAAALDAAHASGLVHRDVKPANVLLTSGREHAYLTDFGLTKQVESAAGGLTKTGQFVGTLDYIPPEQIRGERADGRADVYALGCMLYHALAGRPPFPRDTDAAKLYAHLSDPPPAVEAGAPSAMDAVLARALEKDPDARFGSAGDLGHACRAALSGAGPTAPATRPAAQAPPTRASPLGDPTSPSPVTQPATPGPVTGPAIALPAAPAHPPTRQKRRAPLVTAGVLLAGGATVAVLAIAGVFAGGGDGEGEASTRREPGPPRPATISAGDGPDGLTVNDGIVWVVNSEADAVTRIDAERRDAIGSPVEVGDNPDGVVIGNGTAWVTNTDDGTVTRIDASGDPGEGETIEVGSAPEGLALGDVLWVANSGDGTVSRIDPASADTIGGPITVGRKPIGVFVGSSAVWVTNSFSDSVSRLDARTGRPLGEPTPVGGNPRAVLEAYGTVWVSSADEDTVTRLDPDTGEVRGEPIRVGSYPKEMAALGGSIWVVCEKDDSVVQIAADSARVAGKPVPVGRRPIGIAAGPGALWVANHEDDTVTLVTP